MDGLIFGVMRWVALDTARVNRSLTITVHDPGTSGIAPDGK
jgi:hypothetical protein